jgi:hypothetical protein
MWLIKQGALLTKDNMRRKNCSGDPGCYFCGAEETIDHLMFSYPVAKAVWGVVALCFHQRDRPNGYKQYWPWVKKALPGVKISILLGWLLYVGRPGTALALRKKC